MIRIGQGYDVHRFAEESDLKNSVTLGGVNIPSEHALLAHSDGDVLLHALADALLGAAALGDIGHHFPDTDDQFKGIDSRVLLRQVLTELKQRSYRVVNVDSTLVAQAPKMAPHISAMRENIAADLEVEANCVNVKATTTEKLGFVGRKEGIAAYAVVLIEYVPSDKVLNDQVLSKRVAE